MNWVCRGDEKEKNQDDFCFEQMMFKREIDEERNQGFLQLQAY